MSGEPLRNLQVGAATALVGVGIFQIHEVYTKHAGPLDEMRTASGTDAQARQQLLDADSLAGGLTLLAGGALSLAVRKWYPMLIAGTAFVLVSTYYHRTLSAPAVTHAASAYSMAESAY